METCSLDQSGAASESFAPDGSDQCGPILTPVSSASTIRHLPTGHIAQPEGGREGIRASQTRNEEEEEEENGT